MRVQWKQSYTDLCEEIEALQARAEGLEEQLKIAYKMCYDGKMPGDSFSRIPLDKAIESYDSVSTKLSQVYIILNKMKETKERMEKSIGKLTGLENQVAYRRTVMRQTIRQIASDMGYSEGYVRNVSYRIAMDEENQNMRNVTFL